VEVSAVENGSPLRIVGKSESYSADYVFDSRVPPAFSLQPTDRHPFTTLLQHFKGWFVRTPDDRFDPSHFTMMDYRLRYADSTSFTYVLPLNQREALVEFTLFTPTLIADTAYDEMLRQYFDKILKISDFEITEVEQGVIPMSDFPFHRYSEGQHIRIGTAGGWVKPSSGYSFKNCERNALHIAENLAAGRLAGQGLFSKKFYFYDAIFLEVLRRQNELGPSLFETMYLKNDIGDIFSFLDNETNLRQDAGIIGSFPKTPFLKAVFRKLRTKRLHAHLQR
jgi:lycopene beta-cyclase